MKKAFAFFVVYGLFLSLYSQRIDYKSVVYDGINYLPLSNVSVYNLNANIFAFTNGKGEFTIKVQTGDTLVFTRSVYRQNTDVITEKDILFPQEHFLFFQSILLKEVVVYAFNPDYEEFKRELSSIKLPDYYKKIYQSELTEEEKRNAANEQPNLLRNTPLSSPITALYNAFSKRVKMQQLYYELLKHEDEIEKLPAKYSKELVSRITGLKDSDLMEFMVYCRFSYYDLLKWNQGQIEAAIREKFTEYEYYKLMDDE